MSASFQVEVGLGDGRPFVSQSYWVPGKALREFEEYWEAARDLGLLGGVQMLRAKNTHTIYSPLHEVITPEGRGEIGDKVDNSYFAALCRRNLREKFEVRLSERYADSPLVIPIVIEHIWRHYSSQHVWKAIQSGGPALVRTYGESLLRKAAQQPGAALRIIQHQWSKLIESFDEVFLQPRVWFDWATLRDCTFVSFMIRTESDRMVDAALSASEHAVLTALKPGLGPEGWCHVTCFIPNDQMLAILRVVKDFHREREPPLVSLQDREATFALFQPTFCKVDWRLFDPETLAWQFQGDRYLEQLKGIKPAASQPRDASRPLGASGTA